MYDIIGSREKAVAIIENNGKLAEEIMKKHKNVKSVLRKVRGRRGEFRLYELELVAGDENTEVVHKEYGMRFKLDPRKVYFSPREATERQRIASMVKEGEEIFVMFAGIAPYAIAIAKKVKNCRILCVELNPKACEYARENIRLNKVEEKIEIICGDVREVCKNLKKKFDRIIMPLPEKACEFLDCAFFVAKENCIIHVYGISEEERLFRDVEEKIMENAQKYGAKVEIINSVKVLPYTPRKWKVRIDVLFKGLTL